MKSTLTKILLTSIFFSAAVSPVLFSAEKELSDRQALMIRKASLPKLATALNDDDSEALKKLIRDAIRVDDSNKKDYVKLELGWFLRYPDLTEELIKKESKLVNNLNYEGQTPLQKAVLLDNPEIVKVLIDNRAQVNAKGGKGCIDYRTPLQILLAQPEAQTSVQKNHKRIKNLLIDNGAHYR